MKSIIRINIVVVILLGIGGALVWAFLSSGSGQDADDKTEAPITAASRITQQGGKTVLTFDAQAQGTNGIVVEMLKTDRRSASVEANGIVLQLQPLLDLKSSYNAAQMEIEKARVAAQASESESKRLITLNQGGPNVSDKAVETARAAADGDAAVLRNAQQALGVLKDSMQLHWGLTVASWLENGSPKFDELISQNAYLVQVTATRDVVSKAPAEAMLLLAGNNHVSAHLVERLPQLDPRLQAPGYLYLAPAHSGLIPGMNVMVSLTSGPERSGVVLPNSAVVWWQGRAWAYLEQSPGKFGREQVSTANPTSAGWFLSEGIPPGARVVTAGAQTLLSEESHSQIQADED
jgi:hypothetical protein